jgi:hypothetical protein
VKGGRYTLAEVSLAVWHGVVASGAVAQEFMPGTQFACFIGTTVQILTQQPLCQSQKRFGICEIRETKSTNTDTAAALLY